MKDSVRSRFADERRRAGRTLSLLRRRSGETQQQVAAAIDVDVRTIRRVEAGRSASTRTLDQISAHFGLPSTWFRYRDLEAGLNDAEVAASMARAGVDLIGHSAAVPGTTAELISVLVELALAFREDADSLSKECLARLAMDAAERSPLEPPVPG